MYGLPGHHCGAPPVTGSSWPRQVMGPPRPTRYPFALSQQYAQSPVLSLTHPVQFAHSPPDSAQQRSHPFPFVKGADGSPASMMVTSPQVFQTCGVCSESQRKLMTYSPAGIQCCGKQDPRPGSFQIRERPSNYLILSLGMIKESSPMDPSGNYEGGGGGVIVLQGESLFPARFPAL